jgi:hypothetical protein
LETFVGVAIGDSPQQTKLKTDMNAGADVTMIQNTVGKQTAADMKPVA